MAEANRNAGNEEDKAEDTKHVAELLEITGATKINAAVKLRVATPEGQGGLEDRGHHKRRKEGERP